MIEIVPTIDDKITWFRSLWTLSEQWRKIVLSLDGPSSTKVHFPAIVKMRTICAEPGATAKVQKCKLPILLWITSHIRNVRRSPNEIEVVKLHPLLFLHMYLHVYSFLSFPIVKQNRLSLPFHCIYSRFLVVYDAWHLSRFSRIVFRMFRTSSRKYRKRCY